jgi:predicted metal-dependent peptidase
MSEGKLFLKRQIAGHTHRGTAALNLLLEMSPVLLSFSMAIRHGDATTESQWPGSIESDVWSDGHEIHYAAAFEARGLRIQVSLVAKHILKIALCHPARARRLRLALGGEFDNRLFVLASDLVTNQAISRSAEAGRYYEVLHPTLGEVLNAHARLSKIRPAHIPPHEWSVEQVYAFLARWRDETAAGQVGGSPDAEKAIADMLSSVAIDMELETEEHAFGGESTRMRDNSSLQSWATRVLRAKAGDRPGGLLRAVSGDLPQVKAPWNQLLRADTLRAIARRPYYDWSRPSRRMIARMSHPVFQARPVPFEPARQNGERTPKIAVLVDTSGSISDAILKTFAGTLVAIQRARKTEMRVVIGDAAVQEVIDLKPDQFVRKLRAIKFTGGGGTDFRPLIAEAARWQPDVMVYLTDLAGAFPTQAPNCTMIWAVIAVPGMPTDLQAPFGRVVVLE